MESAKLIDWAKPLLFDDSTDKRQTAARIADVAINKAGVCMTVRQTCRHCATIAIACRMQFQKKPRHWTFKLPRLIVPEWKMINKKTIGLFMQRCCSSSA